MTNDDLKRVWLGVVVVTLVATYPSWVNRDGGQQSSYDAPWVHPSVNPVVQGELYHGLPASDDRLSYAR